MSEKNYLKTLVEDIHSSTVATIAVDGHPQTRTIDMMVWDERGVYFLTAKGNEFYAQLMEQEFIALTATKDKKSVSLRGNLPEADHTEGGVNMNQSERRRYLIQYLLDEEPQYGSMIAKQLCGHEQEAKRIANNPFQIPAASREQKRLLRGLMNVRPPREIGEDFLRIQDEYLTEAIKEKGVVLLSDLSLTQSGLYLWQGDITRLQVDAIVNAANSGMTGCYQPNHTCIDNCIHTFGGVQLRLACAELMKKQGHEEPAGQAKITPAYNLPCKYVLHTVGPVIYDRVRRRDEELLASCYRSCLELAKENGCRSVAFCCISTGVFRFPNRRAAEIAVDTVKQFQKETNNGIEVVFNVFKELDKEIYAELLGTGCKTESGDF